MPKFIIGIGSQRAGSTLLHKILDECTEVFMHPIKELHYYDTLFNVRNESVLKKFSQIQVDREINRLVEENDHKYIDKRYKCYLRANHLLANQDVNKIDYLDLYRPCVIDNEILGEITPEYMILPEEGIKAMRDTLGEDTKIILIARNPVDRFISAFKLLKMYLNDNYAIKNFEEDLHTTMQSMPSWVEQQDALNDYETAFSKYKKYFKDVLFIQYEQITTDKETFYHELQQFLNIQIDQDKFNSILDKKVNSIGETGSISEKTRQDLSDRYQSSTDFLNNF